MDGIDGVIKNMYRIQYVDNTYQMVDWTDYQLHLVHEAMKDCEHVIMIDRCIFKLDHIRSIVFIPPVVEEEKPEQEEATVIETNMGTFEKEMFELMQQMGIEMEVKGERWVK